MNLLVYKAEPTSWLRISQSPALSEGALGKDGRVDYDLNRLGEREFEHLTQALALRVLGPGVEVFGDGPDGGREAAFEGRYLSRNRIRKGHGTDTGGPGQVPLPPGDSAEGASWLKGQLRNESANGWTRIPARSPS